MSRYNFRKRKQPPEDLSKFISSKKRRINLEESLDDTNYLAHPDMSDDVIIYDDEHLKLLPEQKLETLQVLKESEDKGDECDEKSSEDDAEEESSDKSIEESSGDEECESKSDGDKAKSDEEDDAEDTPFDPEKVDPDIFEDIVDKMTKKVSKKRSQKIDDKDLKKLARTEKKKASKLKKLAKQIQHSLEDEEPNIVKILSTPMTEKDRKRMVQLYEIYKNTIENTYEHYELRVRLIAMLRNFSRSTNIAESEHVEQEIERITSTTPKTDVHEIKKRIVELDTEDIIKAHLLEMYRELEETPIDSAQYRNLKEKVEWGVSLPYRKVSNVEIPQTPEEMNRYCIDLRRKLDQEIYGMDEVKEEMIAMRVNQITKPGSKSTLALEGPPGVGKTAICAVFAKAVGKPFERIALGGMRNSDTLKGSDNHFVGSSPSIILAFLRNMKIADGYILLDEIDKIGDKEGQGVQDALLHITDYTQNKEFRDAFLSEFPHDISKLCFMYGMNDRTKIDPILRDRLTIVEVEAYTNEQLKAIIKDYLLPRALSEVGIPSDTETGESLVLIDNSGCDAIISMLSSHIKETGVRKVDEAVRKIIVRINLLRMVTLPDGTTGDLKLKYRVPRFKLPFLINREAVGHLLSPSKNKTPSYIS